MAGAMKNLYVGTNRWVAAINPRTGEEHWRTKLPKGRIGNPVTMLVEGQHLYVGHYGHVFCLDKRTGSILWQNSLSRMGFHPVLLAMEGVAGCSGSGLVVGQHGRGSGGGAAVAG
jgi:glucose dehydrogenase